MPGQQQQQQNQQQQQHQPQTQPQPQLQPQPQPPVENKAPLPRATDPPLPSAPASAIGAVAGPSSVGPVPGNPHAAVGGDKTAIAAGAAAATATTMVDKARPSNSFEKIMLRLSTMYPNFTR